MTKDEDFPQNMVEVDGMAFLCTHRNKTFIFHLLAHGSGLCCGKLPCLRNASIFAALGRWHSCPRTSRATPVQKLSMTPFAFVTPFLPLSPQIECPRSASLIGVAVDALGTITFTRICTASGRVCNDYEDYALFISFHKFHKCEPNSGSIFLL